MQDEEAGVVALGRRDFLRLGGSGVVAASLSALWPGIAHPEAEANQTSRKAPQRSQVLRSKELEITLDADDGLPFEYRWRSTAARLRGEDLGMKMTATVCQLDPWRF